MITSNLPMYLASKSPRRSKLLKLLGIKFTKFTVSCDETIIDGEHPAKTVKRIAQQKLICAEKVKNDGIIITADTIVVIDNKVLGKPKNEQDAIRMLKILSGKTHFVYTGFAIKNMITKQTIIDFEKTSVTFYDLDEKDIKQYVASGSPLDKAGGYGIQGDYGAVFVKKISGCYYNVVGLPISKLFINLKTLLNNVN